jgi:Rad3-related DNA helicase
MNKEQTMIENQLKLEDKNVLPKLIFVSRTHSQLSQVIDSLKEILKDRKDLTYLELASKQQLCINKSINGNKANINEQCQHLLDHSQCQFYHNLSILDFFNKNIEQLISTATANDLCPYYSSRVLTPHTDILCLPYTSILNS